MTEIFSLFFVDCVAQFWSQRCGMKPNGVQRTAMSDGSVGECELLGASVYRSTLGNKTRPIWLQSSHSAASLIMMPCPTAMNNVFHCVDHSIGLPPAGQDVVKRPKYQDLARLFSHSLTMFGRRLRECTSLNHHQQKCSMTFLHEGSFFQVFVMVLVITVWVKRVSETTTISSDVSYKAELITALNQKRSRSSQPTADACVIGSSQHNARYLLWADRLLYEPQCDTASAVTTQLDSRNISVRRRLHHLTVMYRRTPRWHVSHGLRNNRHVPNNNNSHAEKQWRHWTFM